MAKNSTPTSFVKMFENWFYFFKKLAGTSIGLVHGPGFPGLRFIRWTWLCFQAASIKMQDLKRWFWENPEIKKNIVTGPRRYWLVSLLGGWCKLAIVFLIYFIFSIFTCFFLWWCKLQGCNANRWKCCNQPFRHLIIAQWLWRSVGLSLHMRPTVLAKIWRLIGCSKVLFW